MREEAEAKAKAPGQFVYDARTSSFRAQARNVGRERQISKCTGQGENDVSRKSSMSTQSQPHFLYSMKTSTFYPKGKNHYEEINDIESESRSEIDNESATTVCILSERKRQQNENSGASAGATPLFPRGGAISKQASNATRAPVDQLVSEPAAQLHAFMFKIWQDSEHHQKKLPQTKPKFEDKILPKNLPASTREFVTVENPLTDQHKIRTEFAEKLLGAAQVTILGLQKELSEIRKLNEHLESTLDGALAQLDAAKQRIELLDKQFATAKLELKKKNHGPETQTTTKTPTSSRAGIASTSSVPTTTTSASPSHKSERDGTKEGHASSGSRSTEEGGKEGGVGGVKEKMKELLRLLEKTEEEGHVEGEVGQVVWGCESSEPDASRQVSLSLSLPLVTLSHVVRSRSLSLSLSSSGLSRARARVSPL